MGFSYVLIDLHLQATLASRDTGLLASAVADRPTNGGAPRQGRLRLPALARPTRVRT